MIQEVVRDSKTQILDSQDIRVNSGIDTLVSKNIVITQDSKKDTLENKSSSKNKVLEIGPLESTLPCSESKILDFLIAFQEYDYSISDIAKNSGVGFKTTLGVIKELASKQIILNIRNVGRAKMYKLNPDSNEAVSLKKLAMHVAVTKAKINNK